jgi:hypothetical protein
VTVNINDNSSAYTQEDLESMSSAQLRQLWDSLPGPTQAQFDSMVIGEHGKNAGQPLNDGQTIYNYSPQQQQFVDELGSVQETAPNSFDSFMSKAVPAITAAGVGAAFAPAIVGAVGLGAGSVGAGAIQGAVTGAAGAGLTGSNVLKGTALGAAGGALASQVPGVSKFLTNEGLPAPVATGLVKAGAGALTGAVGGAVSGQGAGAGAEAGAISGGAGAVQGSILSGAGTIFENSPQNNPQFDAYNAGNSNNMSYNFDDDPDNLFGNVQTQPMANYNPAGDPNSGNFNGDTSLPGQSQDQLLQQLLGGVDPSTGASYANSLSGGNGSPGGASLPGVGLSVGGKSSGSQNSSLLGQLATLLGGSGGANGGAGLLAQLLGLGSSAAGGALSSSAAKNAASTFGNETSFNPYSISTNNGSTNFSGNGAASSLNPGTAALASNLTGLGNTNATALAAGPGATAANDFNTLASSQLQGQQRLLGNTQDNEFANGVLGSTAGGYQTQAAMNAIGNQISGDQVTANNMASTQQQNQLAQLTGSLNGINSINSSQLQQIQQGSNTGAQASNANATAYQPSLAANSNSNIGNLLTSLGSGVTNSGQSNSNALAQFIAGLG